MQSPLLPDLFIDKMLSIMPAELNMSDFIEICHKPLRKAIRINTLKISIDHFLKLAAEHGWDLTQIPWCDTGFWIKYDEEKATLGNSAEHLAGLFYIQEASSMLPVSALFHFFKETENVTLLDAAAAPGSKTTQIAAKLNNKGLIIANEYSSSRIKMLHSNIQRCGISNVALTHFDAKVFGTWLPETFDAILLDTPCSGEGTVRKDKNAMKNWDQESILEIAKTQKELILSAFHALKEGGILIYSTCTLSNEENQDICCFLKDLFPEHIEFLNLNKLFPDAKKTVTKDGFLHIWPQVYDSEGFFVAALRKTKSAKIKPAKKHLRKFPFTKVDQQTQTQLFTYFSDQFGICDLDGVLYQRDEEFWLFKKEIEPLIDELRFSRLGIKIAEQFGKGRKAGFKTTHEFVSCFGTSAIKNKVELTAEQTREYYQGKDIRELQLPNTKGEVILSYRANAIGLGKIVNTRVKNSLPRDLIKDNNLFTS